jgi:hypothetical protein
MNCIINALRNTFCLQVLIKIIGTLELRNPEQIIYVFQIRQNHHLINGNKKANICLAAENILNFARHASLKN